METSNEKSTGALIHLSVFTQYFIPLGNFIFPAIIWGARKKDSDFVDHHGKQALNFQLSILLYSLILAMIAIPIFIFTLLRNIPTRTFINGDNFKFQIVFYVFVPTADDRICYCCHDEYLKVN